MNVSFWKPRWIIEIFTYWAWVPPRGKNKLSKMSCNKKMLCIQKLSRTLRLGCQIHQSLCTINLGYLLFHKLWLFYPITVRGFVFRKAFKVKNKPKGKQEVVTVELFLKMQDSMTFWKYCICTQQKRKHNELNFRNLLLLRFFSGSVWFLKYRNKTICDPSFLPY